VEAARELDPDRIIEVHLPAEPGWVEGDADRLQQVLANLIDNARKNSPAVEPIEVTLRRTDGELEVAVTDRGPGIDAESLERIFEKFVRGRGDTVSGTGLGLYISRQVVDAHGGRIWAESDPGRGATFRFTLPAATAAAPAPPTSPSTDRAGASTEVVITTLNFYPPSRPKFQRSPRRTPHAQGRRHRSRHHELRRLGPRGRRPCRHPQQRRLPHHPSVVAFSKGGEVLVGEVAKRQAITNPDRTIRSVKRHMGTTWSNEIDGKKYTAQEISARTLMKLKRDAEAYLGDTVTQASSRSPRTSTTPSARPRRRPGRSPASRCCASSTSPPRRPSPTARQGAADETVLVFDLGGGTFDVSILEIGDGVFE